MSERLRKVNDLIRDEIGSVIQSEGVVNNAIVTVLGVDTSITLEHASVRISVVPEQRGEEVLQQLTRQIYALQQSLNRRVVIRPVPKLRFQLDHSAAHASRIEKLLEEVDK